MTEYTSVIRPSMLYKTEPVYLLRRPTDGDRWLLCSLAFEPDMPGIAAPNLQIMRRIIPVSSWISKIEASNENGEQLIGV